MPCGAAFLASKEYQTIKVSTTYAQRQLVKLPDGYDFQRQRSRQFEGEEKVDAKFLPRTYLLKGGENAFATNLHPHLSFGKENKKDSPRLSSLL
ncbi:hypothetical protein EUGRSUZ_B03503 [Eucalyptus grandis]|uniref:Uncharacterized protein n=2 Tax=Eucalyptus grandis TaxID=71139 RepID=A0ACC3LWT2_EUCGR|nr:hypothetical protein EUGRSUZ_B03503 [Eucalyptus grandis]